MKALFASAAVLAAIAVAAPAAAQTWGQGFQGPGASYGAPYGNAYGQQGFARGPNTMAADRIARRIDMGFRSGALTPSEARSLQTRLDTVRQLEWRYGRDGFISASEARTLDRRYADLDRRLFAQLRDRDRNNRYGYNDYYGYRR